jgi:hypothetical protein
VQQVSLPTHLTAPHPHTPPAQVSPRLQATSQRPQWVELVSGSTQLEPQQICPAAQATPPAPPQRHCPPTHVRPAPHAFPHWPQLSGSSVSVRHPSGQQVSLAAHTVP